MAENEAQVTKEKLAALAEQLETGFLKDKRYKDLGKPLTDIVTDFKEFVVDELLKERPDLVQSGDIGSIQATAERAYSAACRGRLSGQATMVKMIPLGASFPFDYVGNWIKKRHEAFLDAKRKQEAGNSAPMNVLLGLAPDKDGKKIALVDANGVALEHRDKGDAKGKPFKVKRSYLDNVPIIIQELTGKKRTMQVTLGIGGEGGDSVVNVKCEKCGFVSYMKNCPNEIEVKTPNPQNLNGPPIISKRKCGTPKAFYEFEDIVSSSFMNVKTNLRIATNDEGKESVSWVDSTSVLGEKTPTTRDEMKAYLKGVLKTKCVLGKDLPKSWEDNKNVKGAWVIYIGTVSSVGRTPDKRGRYRVDLDDTSMSFVAGGKTVGGVPAFIPTYVWNCMDGNQITAYSQIMVVGQVTRREKSLLVSGQWQNLPGQWREPEIDAWGFFVLDGGQERKIKQDVIEGSFTVKSDQFTKPDISGDNGMDTSSMTDSSGSSGDSSPTTVHEQVVPSTDPSHPTTPAPASGKTEDDWV